MEREVGNKMVLMENDRPKCPRCGGYTDLAGELCFACLRGLYGNRSSRKKLEKPRYPKCGRPTNLADECCLNCLL